MQAALINGVAAVLGDKPPTRLGVAVSGGGDSVALLAVLVAYARDHDVDLHVITVDHGIRPEAKHEISYVRDLCVRWDLPHHAAHWNGAAGGPGNFQAAARAARYGLIADWAHANDIAHVALGHTADDQAETVVMRLARGAGVDGLSAMAPCRTDRGVTWIRPFLNTHRATLRSYLRSEQMTWCEDPSNENRDYERIKARDALAVLATVGVTVDGLVQVAHNMTQARQALRWQTVVAARDLVTLRHGVVTMDLHGFQMQPQDIKRRLLAHSVQWVSGSGYGPRGPAVTRALEGLRDGQTCTLDGCQVSAKGGAIWIFREYNAVRDITSKLTQIWDGRWRINGPDTDEGLEVRALGFEALNTIDDWRDTGLPRAALAATPSVWYKDELAAAPIARPDANWTADLKDGAEAYFAALLSH